MDPSRQRPTPCHVDRAALRTMLRAAHPWVAAPDIGPAAVEAGECDRCGAEARLVETCGPSAERYLGRSCAAAAGVDAWCVGHRQDAEAALAVLDGLPPEADVVARLWWVATGEVRIDPALARRARELGMG